MKKHRNIPIVIATFLFMAAGALVFSQSDSLRVDSLVRLLKTGKEDTVRVNVLNALAKEMELGGEYEKGIKYAGEALQVAAILADPAAPSAVKQAAQLGSAHAYKTLGNLYYRQGDYPKVLDNYLKGLSLCEQIEKNAEPGRKAEYELLSCKFLSNIGAVYYSQSEYAKALDYYSRALKINEVMGDKNLMAISLGNIGLVYYDQKDYSKALDYYFRALKLDEELGNKTGMAADLGNIGVAYKEQGDRTKALEYYFKTLKLAEDLDDKRSRAINMGNIGILYTEQAAETSSSPEKKKFYAEAEKYLSEALKIDQEIGDMNTEMQFELSLTDLYSHTARYKEALGHYKNAMALKDSLFNEEKNNEITRKEMNYEFEKKEAAAKAVQDKQAAVAAAEKQRQQIVLILVSCVLLLVVVFAGFIFRALRVTRRQKKEIELQKHLVEEKQKEILDSIHYARRIQTALLPTDIYIDKTLKRIMKTT